MTSRLRSVVSATGFALAVIGMLASDADAQRGGGGRGGGGGGFSRESPAANGGLSSGSGRGTQGRAAAQDRGATAGQSQAGQSRAGQTGENQAARQESRASAQASRQQYGASAQSSRQEAYDDQHWDQGKGLAIAATGAAVVGTVGAVRAASAPPPVAAQPSEFTTAPATPPPAAPAAPCENPTVVPSGGVSYARCGSAWYTQAYGANGPTWVQSAPPPGS